ncbi:galactose-binding domain-containing protein [Cohnella rhizosphaerae]|uniref:Discoidin domain-containing protein n=1 Tax=Cohnella rhizosphaerae TaxID=1457232 RepID=A0A9X4QW80_9BACL|nr:discoidin domain-containing protein [Cohnella rhizosphaerae]MDG0813374.1 discoidin domain-containing protein [Cohnella rhizosphaerae]
MDDTGPQWVKIDLGRSYELDKINLLHYYTATDIRTYHDVIVQLSNDSTFATKTTVFNNDADNSAGQGTGTDAEYAETAAGKDIAFAKTNARYIRLWSNGNTKYDTQHYTEVQAWGVPAVTPTSPLQGRKNVAPLAKDSRITFSSALGNPNRVTDGRMDNGFANQDGPSGGPASPQWIQLDLGQKFRLDQIKVWHFITFDRIYYDVIIQLSNDPTFPSSGTTTVFNNDDNNTAGQGAGTDALYADNAAGKTVNFPLTTARYVRLWANGNQNNNSQHYVEVEVYGSPDYGLGT